MAGIMANSASRTMTSEDTSADNAVTGFIVGETITLSAAPAGSNYSWALAKPTTSTARSDLRATRGATATFRPDAEGYHVVTCSVDGASYVLRIAVVALGTVSDLSALRLSPLADAQVPTPAAGATLYFSSTQDSLAAKLPNGSVVTLDTTAV